MMEKIRVITFDRINESGRVYPSSGDYNIPDSVNLYHVMCNSSGLLLPGSLKEIENMRVIGRVKVFVQSDGIYIEAEKGIYESIGIGDLDVNKNVDKFELIGICRSIVEVRNKKLTELGI